MWSEWTSGEKSWSLKESTGGEVSINFKLCGYSCGTLLLEWSPAVLPLWTTIQPFSSTGWSDLAQATKSEDPTLIIVQIESLSKCPNVVPITLHYFTLDTILDITFMANSDSIVDCQKYLKGPLCSCSIHICCWLF